MRINLGCGDRYADGWHNVDHAGSPFRVDQTVDLSGPLPWPAGSVELVYAGHVLEHLHMADALDLLERLLPLMIPGGKIMCVGPDVVRGAEMEQAGALEEWMTLDLLIYGGHRWPGDEHWWACDEATLVAMLKETGWVDVSAVPIADVPPLWPVADRAPRWQCAVGAVAPWD
jgi:hypothetical protein